MEETSWVRSLYLYLMCIVSFVLVAVGSLGAIGGLVHTVAPDLGHRDTLDRVGIGVANIATKVVDVVNESQSGNDESFCRDVTDNNDDFQACLDDGVVSTDSMGAIQDGISEVKSELQSQIRNNSIDQLIRGLLLVGLGILVFRVHGHRTELFADGLMPKQPLPTPAPEPAVAALIPPPPAADPPPVS